MNGRGDRVATSGIRKADGGYSLAIDNPEANSDYVVFVRARSDSPVVSGNYILTADFATNVASALSTVYSANVSQATEHVSRLNIAKTQLFRFDLLSQASSNDSGVQLTLYDARRRHRGDLGWQSRFATHGVCLVKLRQLLFESDRPCTSRNCIGNRSPSRFGRTR